MKDRLPYRLRFGLTVIVLSALLLGCRISASNQFFGETTVPKGNILRYVSGSEPESLDPQIPTGQPEARVIMAFFDGLVEYHPKSMEAIPAIAESWEVSDDGTEYLFYLRKDAKFSNGDPITSRDFLYTFRRALSPALAAKNVYLAAYVKYAEPYNAGHSFIKDQNGRFLLESDLETDAKRPDETSIKPDNFGPDSAIHRIFDEPMRVTVPSSEKLRNEKLEKNPRLRALIAGKELVPVTAEDVGYEAVDDRTFRIKLRQLAPYFLGLLAHQFFRVVHPPTVEKFGTQWTKPQNIVTSGAYLLQSHKPYDEIIAVKNPTYWDASNVHLDRIEFFPLDEQTTMLNLYKAGRVDATYNHTVPSGWIENVKQYKDEYLLFPEAVIEYYSINITQPPMDNPKVRQAFVLAIDREALAKFRKTVKPLTDFTPVGIFPRYEAARTKVYGDLLKKNNIPPEQWKKRVFDPERARKLLGEAGFPVQQQGSGWTCPNFPFENVSVVYNTSERNKAIAEFLQAQWKQNLGIQVPLNNMEWQTFLPSTKAMEFKGFARRGWVADYMDPFTFLALFYSPKNDSSTGWHDPGYDKLLDEANKLKDPDQRFAKLAEAEFMMMSQNVVVPLSTAGTNWVKKPFVKGLYPNAGTVHAWKFVYIERDPSKWDKDVDNIMKGEDPRVEQQIAQLMQSQLNLEKSRELAKNQNTAAAE